MEARHGGGSNPPAPTMSTESEERWCFEQSFKRPSNFFKLSAEEQWAIDKRLGILDWDGLYLTEEDHKRFKEHYDK